MTAGVNHSFSEPDLLRLFSKYRYRRVIARRVILINLVQGIKLQVSQAQDEPATLLVKLEKEAEKQKKTKWLNF